MKYRRLGICALLGLLALSQSSLAGATSQPYDLGQLAVSQSGVAQTAIPVPLTGAIAVPPGNGPFPLVVLLHGRHPGCHFAAPAPSQWPCNQREIRYDLGLNYLAAELAAAGYLTLLPNLNGAYADAFGANEANRNALAHQRGVQIVAAHLHRLAAANRGEPSDFPVNLAGKVRTDQQAFIGHSLGGSLAVYLVHTLGVESVDGLLLLAPTPSLSASAAPAAYRLPDVPVGILAGSCDRDVYDLSSLYYFEAAQADQLRTQPAGAALIFGANHNFFNAAVEADDYRQQPDNAPQCGQASSLRLSRRDQERFTAAYTRAFLSAVFDGGAAWETVGLDPATEAPTALFGVPVATNLDRADRQQLSLPKTANNVLAVDLDSLKAQFCKPFFACGEFLRLRPRFPEVWRLSWQQPAYLRWQMTTPLRAQAFASLQLRIVVDSSDLLNLQGSPPIGIVLEDRNGQRTRVDIPATAPALRSFPPDSRWGYQAVPAYVSALRIPLTRFAGIDLNQITALEIRFDAVSTGAVELADISLIGPRKHP